MGLWEVLGGGDGVWGGVGGGGGGGGRTCKPSFPNSGSIPSLSLPCALPNTEKVPKNVIYLDKTKPANIRGDPLCQATKATLRQQLNGPERRKTK